MPRPASTFPKGQVWIAKEGIAGNCAGAQGAGSPDGAPRYDGQEARYLKPDLQVLAEDLANSVTVQQEGEDGARHGHRGSG